MSLDLNTLLKDWEHESGAIKVRKVLGLDGREKLHVARRVSGQLLFGEHVELRWKIRCFE